MEQDVKEKAVTQQMRSYYMNDLVHVIRNISDLNYQRRIWIHNLDPNIFDTWEETMCRFFDDADIDNFLKNFDLNLDPEYGLSQHHIEALWKFRNIMRQYSDDTPLYMDPREVLADPRWHEVVACAQETLKAFEDYRVPTDNELTQI